MARTLLVGLDGSKHSRFAVETAIRMSRQAGTLLVGVGVVDEPGICKGEAVPLGGGYYKADAEQKHMQSARDRVAEFQRQFTASCAQAGVPSRVVTLTGDPAGQIAFESQRVDAVVLGAVTHFHFETESEPCDTLRQVIKQASRPVIAAPDATPRGESVVIAYDGSLQAARMLASLWATGFCAGGSVHVIGIEDDVDEAKRRIQPALDYLHSHDVAAAGHPATGGQVVQTILEKAETLNAGLIALGAYGRSSLHEFFFGSVTQSMLKRSRIPMFLHH